MKRIASLIMCITLLIGISACGLFNEDEVTEITVLLTTTNPTKPETHVLIEAPDPTTLKSVKVPAEYKKCPCGL